MPIWTKEILGSLIVVLLIMLAASIVVALDDIAVPQDFYDGSTRKTQVDAIDVRVTALEAKVAQADTNATTTATGYTPAYVGQVLVGGAGTGTNAIWIAKGTTTNDWVQVEP